MKHILTLLLLVMQIAVCAAKNPFPLTNPTPESKVLYIVADSCPYLLSFPFSIADRNKYDYKKTYHALNIPTKNGIFVIGCKEEFVIEGDKKTVQISTNDYSHYNGVSTVEVTIRAGERVEAVNRIVLEVSVDGRILPLYIPIHLLS